MKRLSEPGSKAHRAAQARIKSQDALPPRKAKVGKLTVKNIMDNEPKRLKRIRSKGETPVKVFTAEEIALLLQSRSDN